MKRRLFIAIPLPREISEALVKFQQNASAILEREGINKQIRWTAPENIHITVFFIGDTIEEKIPLLIKRLETAYKKLESFSLEFSEIIFAPPKAQPRMIWALFKDSSNFQTLVKSTAQAVVPLIPNVKFSHKTLVPHATLARFKNPFLKNHLELHNFEISKKLLKSDFNILLCDLMESNLTPSGPLYTQLAVIPLLDK